MAKNKNKTPLAKQKQPTKHKIAIKQQLVAEQFEGPLPPPSTLAGYNNIQKGFADRIIIMAENEASHRHEMDKRVLDARIQVTEYEANEARLGQIFGLLIGVTALIAGSYTAIQGFAFAGSVIGTSGVIGLVSVFIMGRKTPDKNNNETKELAPPQNNTGPE